MLKIHILPLVLTIVDIVRSLILAMSAGSIRIKMRVPTSLMVLRMDPIGKHTADLNLDVPQNF